MKALQLVPAMEEGGVERYVVRLNAILVSAGWENVVVSRGGRLDAEIVAGGGRVVHLDTKSKNPLTAPMRAWRLRQVLKREKPDVVCAHSRVPAWLYVLGAKGLGIRWMTYAHGANSVSRYSRVMTMGARVMCPSNFVRDHLMRAYGVPAERFRVVPHGIDAGRFDPEKVDAAFVAEKRRAWGIGPGTKVVMSIGRITRLKGFDTLIRASCLMLRASCGKTHAVQETNHESRITKHDLKVVIVGGAEKGKEAYLAELKALVASLGLEDVVVFAGQQSQTPECLSMADVVVSANTTKPESFGLTMAEALMMGKPVVAKAFGGALDIVRDGVDGVLVGAKDSKRTTASLGGEKTASVQQQEGTASVRQQEGTASVQQQEGTASVQQKEGTASVQQQEFAEAIVKALEFASSAERRNSARERFDLETMAKKTMAVYKEMTT